MNLPEGFHLTDFETLDSTNEEARRQTVAGAVSGTWFRAAAQSGGRGRRGRTWVSEPGNLYASLLLRPYVQAGEAAQLSFVMAVALHDALTALLPDTNDIACKWPNDLLLNGKKVAGILLESISDTNHTANWVIAGIGVNVKHFPDNVEYPATSLLAAGSPDLDRDHVFEVLAAAVARWLATWQKKGFPAIRNAWKLHAKGLGDNILVRLETQTLEGIFLDIDERGALLLLPGSGFGQDEARVISAGDVFFPPHVGHKE